MIKLEVEHYCHECRAFKPVSELIEYADGLNYRGELVPRHIQITVRCENEKRCLGIARHINKEFAKKCRECEAKQMNQESETIKDDRET